MTFKLKAVALAMLALILAACGSSPQNLIVGRWQADKAKAGDATAPYTQVAKAIHMTAEFGPDGTAQMTMMGHTFQGTYKLTGEELEWSTSGITKKARAKVTATQLEVTDDANQTILYKRM
jgi:hypothetical protein